jgi:hypothetical protein
VREILGFPVRKFLSISRIWILALPLIFTFVGAASNQIVLVANHDKFPVMVNSRNVESHGGVDDEGMLDDIHCLMTDKTHLNYLADIFEFKTSIVGGGFAARLRRLHNGLCTVLLGHSNDRGCNPTW